MFGINRPFCNFPVQLSVVLIRKKSGHSKKIINGNPVPVLSFSLETQKLNLTLRASTAQLFYFFSIKLGPV